MSTAGTAPDREERPLAVAVAGEVTTMRHEFHGYYLHPTLLLNPSSRGIIPTGNVVSIKLENQVKNFLLAAQQHAHVHLKLVLLGLSCSIIPAGVGAAYAVGYP